MEITDKTTREELIEEIKRLKTYYRSLVLSIIHHYSEREKEDNVSSTLP